MNGRRITVLLFTIGLVSLPGIAVADDVWYGTVDLGQPHFDGRFNSSPFTATGALNGTDTSGGAAWRLVGGYQFTSYFSLEAGYVDLGHVQQNGYFTFAPSALAINANLTAKARGFVADAVGNYPFGKSWSVYARAGALRSHTKIEGFSILSANDTDFTYGAGVSWSYSERLRFHIGWDQYNSLGNSTTGKYSVSVLAFGLAYLLE